MLGGEFALVPVPLSPLVVVVGGWDSSTGAVEGVLFDCDVCGAGEAAEPPSRASRFCEWLLSVFVDVVGVAVWFASVAGAAFESSDTADWNSESRSEVAPPPFVVADASFSALLSLLSSLPLFRVRRLCCRCRCSSDASEQVIQIDLLRLRL